MLKLDVHVNADRATDEFRAARRELNARTRQGLIRAGEVAALPAARVATSHLKVAGEPVAGSLIVRGTSRRAYITTAWRGKKGRAVGLQEYGGRVDTIIAPRHKRTKTGRPPALHGKAYAHPVGKVTRSRQYRKRLAMTTAVAARSDEIARVIGDEVMKAFREFG